MNILSQTLKKLTLVLLISLPLVAHASLPDFTVIVDNAKDSVVNISTKTKAKHSDAQPQTLPEFPEGSRSS